uniref:copper amine oxidase n=1 Tax=Marinobacterium profundum TaxID=1714300 RepID=UPI000832FFB3|nr:stalk domain-containing protein [Marinobacterium profundum]
MTFKPKALVKALMLCGALSSPVVLGHGSPVEYITLESSLESTGASMFFDQDAQQVHINKGEVHIRATVGERQAEVNGKIIDLMAPIKVENGQVLVDSQFANEVLQNQLLQTFAVSAGVHPMDPLSADEIALASQVVRQSAHYKDNLRFTEILLAEQDKARVWDWTFGGNQTFQRLANFTVLDGKQVIEGTVDLGSKTVTRWEPIEGAHGMVILDDMVTVQKVIENSPAYAQALAKRDIHDVSKVIATPLTVGYFEEADGLKQEQRLLKVVSYLNVGDGNFWAHPIEGLVAVVDLETESVLKIEDDGVIPVPLTPRPYDGRDLKEKALVKPLIVSEPQGPNYSMNGNMVHWQNWDFHLKLDSRVGLVLSTLTYNDGGTKRKVMYEGSLGGMIVPYGDPDTGWYFKAYLDSGDYGMGVLTSPLELGSDVPTNARLFPATVADSNGEPYTIPNAIAIFERYAGPEYKHYKMKGDSRNESRARRELVVRWISTIGNYDYMFDWVLLANGTIKLDVGASGIEAVKGVNARTMHDATAKEDTRYGTLIDHNIVGTTHQHIYNFRLDLDVDGEQNSLMEIDPVVAKNTAGGPRKSVMTTNERIVPNEQEAIQKFDPSTIRLMTNTNKENRMGNPVSYQVIPFAGGTHPIAKGALFSPDEWLYKRVNFMDKQIWVTQYNPEERFPEGKYPNQAKTDTGLKAYTDDNQSIQNEDNVLWMTTGATHIARAEEWPMMPTEYVHAMLKPWNFFDQTPTLNLPKETPHQH